MVEADWAAKRAKPVLGMVGSWAPKAWEGRWKAAAMPTVAVQRELLREVVGSKLPMERLWTVFPARRWPRDRLCRMRPNGEERKSLPSGAVDCRFLGRTNLEPLKSLTVALDLIRGLKRWGQTAGKDGKQPWVFVYNLGPTHYLGRAVLAGARSGGIRTISLITDLDTPETGDPTRFERWRFREERRTLAGMDRMILLNRHVAEDFQLQPEHYRVLGGILPDDCFAHELDLLPFPSGTGKTFLYAGSWNRLRGVDRVLEAFGGIVDPEARLWITGAGPEAERVEQTAGKDRRIEVLGFLRDDDARLDAFRGADFVVNPHRVEAPHARSVFPSKLGEALFSGRVVITTPVGGIETWPDDMVLRTADDSVKEIRAGMESAIQMAASERFARARKARAFGLRELTWERNGPRVAGWIREWIGE